MSRVLLVDDEELIREALSDGLIAHGLSVLGASSANDAIRKCMNESFDAMIVDFRLKDKTCFDIIKHARSINSLNKTTPIILMSGLIHMHDILPIKKDLAAAFIKPFDLGDLIAKLDKILPKEAV